MDATITDISEKVDYRDPKHPVKYQVVRYRTDQDTEGSIEILDAGATPEKILAAVRADIARVHGLVNKPFKV